VGIAPLGGGVAAGVGAAAVAEPQVGGLGWGEQAPGSAAVEDLAVRAQDQGNERGVAGEAADGLGSQERAGVGAAEHGASGQTR
jgi:hypothetical protein